MRVLAWICASKHEILTAISAPNQFANPLATEPGSFFFFLVSRPFLFPYLLGCFPTFPVKKKLHKT